MGKSKKPEFPEFSAKLTKDFRDNTRIRFIDPAKDLSRTLIQTHLVGHEILGANYYIKRKNFDSYLMWMVTKGCKLTRSGNVIRRSEAITFGVENCMDEVTAWIDPTTSADRTTEQYYLHFYPTPTVKNICDFVIGYMPTFKLEKDVFGFCDIVTEMLDELDAGTYDEKKWAVRLYGFFIKLSDYVKNGRETVVPLPKAVTDTLDFIAANYSDRLNLADCAENVHLAPTYLESLFKKHLDISVAAYVSRFRFNKAAELLISSDMTISQIAAEVGLNDSQSLIRLFRKNIDTTPLAYRKHYSNK
ncbi:MAG: helix-turn-helix transcriptional regulator [Clostridia bacterium]|nr:helix-turn-helix transcriptional regulator [Clostridia bacterium]